MKHDQLHWGNMIHYSFFNLFFPLQNEFLKMLLVFFLFAVQPQVPVLVWNDLGTWYNDQQYWCSAFNLKMFSRFLFFSRCFSGHVIWLPVSWNQYGQSMCFNAWLSMKYRQGVPNIVTSGHTYCLSCDIQYTGILIKMQCTLIPGEFTRSLIHFFF